MIKTIKTIEQVSCKAASATIYTNAEVSKAFKRDGNGDSVTELVMGRSWWRVTKSLCADVCKACNWYIQGCDKELASGELDEHQTEYVERRKAQWQRVYAIAYAKYRAL